MNGERASREGVRVEKESELRIESRKRERMRLEKVTEEKEFE